MPNISDRELNRLRNSVGELSALNQIANAINVTMSVEKITHVIIDHCINRVGASQGGIFLLEDEDQEDKFKTFVREMKHSREIPLSLNINLTGWMIKNKSILLSNEPGSDDRFRGVNFEAAGIKSVLAAPLLSRSGLIGVLALFNKETEGGFDQTDQRFLGIVGTQAAKVVENARLAEKEEQLSEIQEELRVANEIQKGFLPEGDLTIHGCEIYGFNAPAKEMGGDYFDIVELDKNRIFVSLGDVSGKGMPAALLMANAQAVLRSHLTTTGAIELTSLAESLNRLIFHFTPAHQYITAIFGLYDAGNKTLHYINAGHCPPLVLRKGGSLEIPSEADLVVGVLPEFEYSVHTTSMQTGDTVIWYTDGITEAFNESNEEFGEERLNQILKENHSLGAAALGQKVVTEVARHRGETDQSDDITMLILKTG